MFVFEDLADLDQDWYLGHERNSGRISKNVLGSLSNNHLVGVQFLFENLVKKRGGAILNEDVDMNMPLQVCTFLSSIKDKITHEVPVLIICPDLSLCKWHYHINEVGLKPHIVTSESFIPCEVYLLTFESLKLSQQMVDLKYFCVVIDGLDIIATKLITRKLKGEFNIGLTKRNFYVNPDQKLKWTMLNWASPGCVGKLNDFYSIDRLHSLAFADNYRFWWLRLTWKFCTSFEEPTLEDLEEYQQKLNEWGESHGIKNYSIVKETKPKRKATKSSEESENKKKKYLRKQDKQLPDIQITSEVSSTILKNGTDENKNFSEEEHESDMEVKEEKSVITETVFKKDCTLDEDTENNERVESHDSNDSFNMYSSPSKVKSESDEEDPILSIINSSQQPESVDTNNLHIKKLSESSDSDSEILSDIVNRDNPSRYYRSQQISQMLENLSDDEKIGEESEDDSFFSEFIHGK